MRACGGCAEPGAVAARVGGAGRPAAVRAQPDCARRRSAALERARRAAAAQGAVRPLRLPAPRLPPQRAQAADGQEGPQVYLSEKKISIPLYYTAEREKAVISLDVPCANDHDKWLQAGVAFFLKN
ncbi:Uncharacterized protein GBIM_12527 [Gryllus bimaculatus]|nr:Uncharacterized protein GBIM_12527 [Gryllus bimaculatus]